MALGLELFLKQRPFTKEESKKFNLFSRGNSGKWINVWSNQPGIRLLFDFRYLCGIPLLAARRYAQTVAVFAAGIGMIDAPSSASATGCGATRISKTSALFAEGLIDQLALLDRRAEYSIEKGGDWVIVYRHGLLVSPVALVDFGRNAERLAALFVTLKDTPV